MQVLLISVLPVPLTQALLVAMAVTMAAVIGKLVVLMCL